MIRKQPKFKYIFLGLDICIITLSFALAIIIAIPDFWDITRRQPYFCISHLLLWLIFLVVYLFCFFLNNLYNRDVVISRYRQFILILKSILAGGIVCVIFLIIFNLDYFVGYGKNLILYCLFFLPFFLLVFRVLIVNKILRLLVAKKLYHTNVLIVGGDKAARNAADALKQDVFSNFHIVGFLDDYKKKGTIIWNDFQNMGTLDNLKDIIRDNLVDEILIAINKAPYERLAYIVEKCLGTGKAVRIYSDILGVIAEKMNVEFYSSIPVMTLSQNPLDSRDWSVKYNIDTIISGLALIILFPLFLAIAIGIKLSSKGPVIFKQVRIGKGGKPFEFYKFRSMHMSLDDSSHKEYVKDFIRNGNQCQNKEIKIFKITSDPRIFKFGKFIRKTSLDELPQLFNVLKGDMSLVAPRPCLPYEWDCYEEWHKKRLDILPGCTGLWQALGRSSVSFEDMVILDLYYISNMTLWFDLKIILQTFPVIFLGKGGF